MGIDLVALTAFLSPILPFLIKGGEEAAKEAGKKFGIDAWEKAKGVWGKLYPKIEAKEAAKEAVEDLAVAPEDRDLQTTLRVQLKKLLEKDESLVEEILQIMKKDSSTETSNIPNIELEGDIDQQAGDNSTQIGQIGSAGTINLKRI